MYIQKESSLQIINCMWYARAEHDEKYTQPANEYWSLGFASLASGAFAVELYGPSLLPRALDAYKGDEYWGVEFNAYVAINILPKNGILNCMQPLAVAGKYFKLGSNKYIISGYKELEALAVKLEQDDTITADPRICRALQGDSLGFSERSRQRHFKNVTGLTKKQIEQLQRARHAYYLLQSGNSPTEAAHAAGYSDQSHMTRSLRILRGETPAQIIASYLKHI